MASSHEAPSLGSTHLGRIGAPVRQPRTVEELIAEYGPPDRPEFAPAKGARDAKA